MRRILFSTIKDTDLRWRCSISRCARSISPSLPLAYDLASLGWIVVAIAVTFLQIFVGVLRWRESQRASAARRWDCGRRCGSI